MDKLKAVLGVDSKTVRRWQQCYLERLSPKGEWKDLGSRLSSGLTSGSGIQSLYAAFVDENDPESGMVRLLRFIATFEHIEGGGHPRKRWADPKGENERYVLLSPSVAVKNRLGGRPREDGGIVTEEKEKMLCHRWAELRFSVVGGLLSSPPGPGELQEALRALAEKDWIHPKHGGPVRFGFSTIETWYYRAKESNNPIEALRTPERVDAGEGRAFSPALLAALKRQYELHPGWSYDLHHENLAVIAASDPSKYGKAASYSTIICRIFIS